MQPITSWEDSFGKQVTNGVRNQIDISSTNTFSPERLRYFKNGTRIRLANDTTFTDQEGEFLIEPAAGDTCRLQTAERPRYVVGFDAVASLEGQVLTSLGSGDTVKYGLDDDQTPQNAAYFEINGDSDNRLVLVKGGSEVKSQTFEYPRGVDETEPIRYEITYNWYGVGTFQFSIFYTENGQKDGEKAINKLVGELAVDSEKTVNDANFHLFHEVDATTSGQRLSAGSYGFNTLGDVSVTSRTKVSRIVGSAGNYSGTGNYEPIAAARVNPDRAEVFAQLTSVEAIPDAGDGELMAIVVPESKTDASNFTTPVQQSPDNSVIEETTDITTFPDQDGNVVTDAANPNGYQVGFYATEITGQGATQNRTSTLSRQIRPIYEDDVVVFLYKDDGVNERTVNLVYNTRQLW